MKPFWRGVIACYAASVLVHFAGYCIALPRLQPKQFLTVAFVSAYWPVEEIRMAAGYQERQRQ